MLPDRVFGRIERKFCKKKDTIVNPAELIGIIRENKFGSVIDICRKRYSFRLPEGYEWCSGTCGFLTLIKIN